MSSLLKRFGWPQRRSPEAREAAAWIESVNPLRGMTTRRAMAIFDSARSGNTVQLQWLYNEIEAADPTLMICAERRGGVLQSLDWTVAARAERRTSGYDQGLAAEQQALLERLYGQADSNNLSDAVEHLASAFFRGFSHIAPVWSPDGLEIERFDILNGWNFVRDPVSGTWHWNPAGRATGGRDGLDAIPPDELCSIVRPRHIDFPALTIYLRSAVGERAWGQMLERYGIPPVIITMPADIPAGQEETYRAAAEQVAQGASGSLPYGATVNYATDARGADPFGPFLEHQQQLVVLMATGGMLTSLAESGSGTLAGGAHEDTWREVWRKDAAIIADAMNRTVTRLALDRHFPGRPHLAYWALDTETPPSPAEVFEAAGKAIVAGYIVDQKQLEEQTGYTLSPAPAVAVAPASGPSSSALFAVGNTSKTPRLSVSARENPPNPPPPSAAAAQPPCISTEPHCIFTIANAAADDVGPAAGALEGILEAFAADWSKLADKVAALAKLPDAERSTAAADLLANLTGYAPEDPRLAGAIEELLANRFAQELTP